MTTRIVFLDLETLRPSVVRRRRALDALPRLGMVAVAAAGMGPLRTPWPEVPGTSDIVTLHGPLTAATRHRIGRPEFLAMKRRPVARRRLPDTAP